MKDDDGDGVADVDELDSKEFVARKTKLVLTKINPTKVMSQYARCNCVFGVIFVMLSLQFANYFALTYLTIAPIMYNTGR